MASGEEKPWKTQGERKAYFTGIAKEKAAHAAKNRSSYVQGNWQSTGPSLPTQTWPLPTHAYPPGQFQSQPTMQSQPPYLSQEQATHEINRLHQYNSERIFQLHQHNSERIFQLHQYNSERSFLQHQYNTEQSFNHLRSSITQPVAPSGQMHPVNQMPSYPSQYQHYAAAGPYVPSYPPQYQYQTTASPYVPFHSPRIFKPGSVRCEEVNDSSPSASSVVESSDGKPSETPVSSVHSPDATIGKIQEPDLKRKAETEMVETVKKTRVNSKAEPEGPTAIDKDPTKMDTELDRPHETTLALPQKHQSPSVDDASSNHDAPSQHSCECAIKLTIGDANAPTIPKADIIIPDPSKTSYRATPHHGMKSGDVKALDLSKTPHHGMKSGDVKALDLSKTLRQGTKSPSTVVEPRILPIVGDALETNSNASTTCASPELPYRSVPFKASDSVCKDLPGSLFHSSLDDLPDLDISARDTPPPNSPRVSSFSHEVPDAVPNSLGKKNTRNQHITFHERLATPEKRTFRMLLQLESTLKVAQEVPMPRAKPKYDSCYLPDLEDGDVTVVNQDNFEDSEYTNDSGDDEDEGSFTVDNLAEDSDDEE